MSTLPLPYYLEEIYYLGGKAYAVGGTVRDDFLGLSNKDSDILVTHLPIETLIKTLKKFGDTQVVGKVLE
ncbi:MAG: hypothetical protein IPJ69_13390 [Deltaproteobacteria bacterium]|nr:MAG: hypothetical protein IPJ69_13390 [Deltaproteobacteria bacterium]